MLCKALIPLAFVATPAIAAPSFSLACDPAVEGDLVSCTITKSAKAASYSKVAFETHSGTAKPGVDYDYTLTTLTFANSELVRRIFVPTLDNTKVDGSRSFTARINSVRYALIATGSATATIADNDVAPAPVPPPPPPAITLPNGVASNTIFGLPGIASEFDPKLGLSSDTTIPGSGVPDVVGAFRFICGAGQVLADDPIVYPGQPGKSHLHQFYGNTSADAFSTFASLRAGGQSTCNYGAFPLNRSAYWMPAMLDGRGNVVRPDYVAIYYKRRPLSDPVVSDPANPQFMGFAVPIPNGLKFIFGFNMATGEGVGTDKAWFNCDGPTAGPGAHYSDLASALANCPAGNRLGALLEAPTCWDGKNLDSADHHGHMAYAGYGGWGYLKCDAQHPYVVPTFQLGAWYAIAPGDDTSKWSLSSDAMYPALPKGKTLHADWFGAWDNPTIQLWTDFCINKLLNCSGGQLGNMDRITEATVPIYNGVPSWSALPRLVPAP